MAGRSQRSFVVFAEARNVKDFTFLARQAARLKKFGRVDVNISSVSGRDVSEVPPGGSPWHEYASYARGMHKFFPHAKLAPFVDKAFVARNRRHLQACLAVLRKLKLHASFALHEPHFLPEAFFRKYPHLRGPRMDHPRRTKREEFAMCLDCPEGREIFMGMVAELAKEAPELRTYSVLTNDAGAGFCWGEYLYPGPNGPDHCRGISTGQRIGEFVKMVRQAAGRSDLDVIMAGMFSKSEREQVGEREDEHFFFGRAGERSLSVGSTIDNPVLGIVDPVQIIQSLQRWRGDALRKVLVGTATNYRRGHDLEESIAKALDIVVAFLNKPAYGLMNQLTLLRELCVGWAGEAYADELLEAFVLLRKAYELRAAAFPRFTGNYVGVSMRLINRPLVAIPEKLSPAEEAYFLPYVFNPYESEARSDYLDWHGSRLAQGPVTDADPRPRIDQVDQFRSMLNQVAGVLEGIPGRGKDARFFHGMGTSLRMYACIMRSIHNFYSVQIVRDRNREKLSGEPVVHPKVGSMTGDPDLLLLHEFMRDELDNTAEFIRLLDKDGLPRIARAKTPQLEDTFLLGPNFRESLDRKMQIMRDHWLDASVVMAPPHK